MGYELSRKIPHMAWKVQHLAKVETSFEISKNEANLIMSCNYTFQLGTQKLLDFLEHTCTKHCRPS